MNHPQKIKLLVFSTQWAPKDSQIRLALSKIKDTFNNFCYDYIDVEKKENSKKVRLYEVSRVPLFLFVRENDGRVIKRELGFPLDFSKKVIDCCRLKTHDKDEKFNFPNEKAFVAMANAYRELINFTKKLSDVGVSVHRSTDVLSKHICSIIRESLGDSESTSIFYDFVGGEWDGKIWAGKKLLQHITNDNELWLYLKTRRK